jgi:hypothetical protein
MSRKVAVGTIVACLMAAGVASAVSMQKGSLRLGASTPVNQRSYVGFYDGHKDTYLITDVSSRSQAKALQVNYSAGLAKVKNIPAQYFIMGRAAAGQLAVFGSEPGEHDYNPLWIELFVTWKPGIKPVLLVRDDQINALAKAHKLTVKDAGIVLNAPIIKVGKKK